MLYRQSLEKIHRQHADVWALGNCLYQILTKRWDFEHVSTVQARELLQNGNHSIIPNEFRTSKRAADTALLVAIHMAWMPNPEERPTAQQIANYLSDQLVKQSSSSEPPWNIPAPILSNANEDNDGWTENYRDESVMAQTAKWQFQLSPESRAKLMAGQAMVIHPL